MAVFSWGAVTTQRPDLFQVALPGVGVLDMLRYHTFTAGAGWAYDYGTSEESEADVPLPVRLLAAA
jgi:prolyl oligopeptidase